MLSGMSGALRSLLLLLSSLLLCLGVSTFYFARWYTTPMRIPSPSVELEVREGDGFGSVSSSLATRDVLKYPRVLNLIARATGADARMHAGEFELRVGTTPRDLLALLHSQNTVRYFVTLPEGIRLDEALKTVQSSDGVAPVLSGVQDAALLRLVTPHTSAEGFFLPETYQYERGDTDLEILTAANALMRDALTTAWSTRDPSLPYLEPYEALVMASIIEKETGVASERARIGGVFVRRLELGMRLQTDPTVIYGLGPDFDGNLTRAHLRDERNRYNSYRLKGLPPTPIALPGRDALAAALHPEAGEALYFVARGDGSHEFSSTLEAHNEAVARFQYKRRPDYRSSPAPSLLQERR
ncbi:MAG: endolytic transglycosylase MltG [Pseudomonadota bacterium]